MASEMQVRRMGLDPNQELGAMSLGGPSAYPEAQPAQPVTQPTMVAQAQPQQQAMIPTQAMPPAQPGAAAMPGAVPNPNPQAAKQPYNPEQAFEAHMRKQFPDITPEELDYAKSTAKARMQQYHFKRSGKENRALATEYMVALRSYDAALRNAERDAQEFTDLKKAYQGEVNKYKGQVPPGLIHPKDDPSLQARFAKTKAAVIAADGRRKKAWNDLQGHYKKTTGQELDDKNELSPMAIRMLMMGNDKGFDETEDLVDEYHRVP